MCTSQPSASVRVDHIRDHIHSIPTRSLCQFTARQGPHHEASSPTLPSPPPRLRWCTSLSLPTQCFLRAGVILTNTIALFSSVRAFSAILSCKSASSASKSRNSISTACSCHLGGARVRNASAKDRSPSSIDRPLAWNDECIMLDDDEGGAGVGVLAAAALL